MNLRCIHCAGKGLCGRPVCPIKNKLNAQAKINSSFKKDFFGASPNILIGMKGYPKVNVGVLSNEGVGEMHDSPKRWAADDVGLQKLIDLRSSLINSRFRIDVKSFDDRLMDVAKEVSLAKKPVDVEVNLEKRPNFSLTYNQSAAPYGPAASIRKAAVTENPKIPKAVDSIVSENHLLAKEAISTLYKKGYDEHYLTKVLSAGNLGMKESKKLVPTRWSITATDDMLGKELIDRIRQMPEMDCTFYFGGYLGNYYSLLFFPGIWSYELFEMMASQSSGSMEWSTDFETFAGRKSYVKETAGGYYAARLAILEHMIRKKRQASVLALRFITKDYWAPMGVWVVREAVRKALLSRPIIFGSDKEIIQHAKGFIKERFGLDIASILDASQLKSTVLDQKRIDEYY